MWYHCPKHCRNLISKLPDENCFVETIACPRHMLFMCVCVCPRRFFRFMVSMPVIKPCLILPNPLFQVHVARCQESRYQCVYVVSVKMLYIYAILVHSIFVLVHMDGHIYTYTHIDFCYVSPYSKRVLYNEGAAISSPETWSRLSFDCTWRKVCCWKPCLPQAHVVHVRLFSLFIACAMHANIPSVCSAP